MHWFNSVRLVSHSLLDLTVFQLLLRRYFRLIYEIVVITLRSDDPDIRHEFPYIQREAAEFYPGEGGLHL